MLFDDSAELDGLTAGELSATARAASDRGEEGKYLVGLPLFSGHPYLASLTVRESRQRVFQASLSRGSRGNEHDNSAVLIEIVRLRAERAALQEIIGSSEPEPFALQAQDWAFCTEKVRQARYDIDTAALRPWFKAERVLQDGVFFAASQLYGVTFTERADLVAYHPGARVLEVHDADKTAVGLYVLDLYTRDSKRGGGWMNPIVSQSALRGTLPLVVNNLNVSQPGDGQPTLLTLDEVTTLFHEFGHALHGLFARVTYPHFAGPNVFRDFVEFPSQVNEMWILWSEVLSNYARHHETGEPLDAGIVERLRATETFDQAKDPLDAYRDLRGRDAEIAPLLKRRGLN